MIPDDIATELHAHTHALLIGEQPLLQPVAQRTAENGRQNEADDRQEYRFVDEPWLRLIENMPQLGAVDFFMPDFFFVGIRQGHSHMIWFELATSGKHNRKLLEIQIYRRTHHGVLIFASAKSLNFPQMPNSRINQLTHFNGNDYIIVDQIHYPQPSCAPKVICIDLLREVTSGEYEIRFGYYWNDQWIQDALMAPTADAMALFAQIQQRGWLHLNASSTYSRK